MAMPPPPIRRGPTTGPVINRPVSRPPGPMPGPVINRPVTPRTGPTNPGPMPLPQPTGPMNPGPMPTPTMGGDMSGGMGGPQVNVKPNPALGGGMGPGMKRGGKVKKMAAGGSTSKVSTASKRADGIAQRGKTKCKMY